MKIQILTLAFFALLHLPAFAQEGSLYVGGTVGYRSNTFEPEGGGEEQKFRIFQFSPEVGYWLNGETVVGIGINMTSSKSTDDGDEETTTFDFNPGVYLRRFFPMGDDFSLFVGANLGAMSSKTTTDIGIIEVESTEGGFFVGLDLGGTLQISDRFTLIGRYGVLQYSRSTRKVEGDKTSTNSNFNFLVNSYGPAFSVGIYYTLIQ